MTSGVHSKRAQALEFPRIGEAGAHASVRPVDGDCITSSACEVVDQTAPPGPPAAACIDLSQKRDIGALNPALQVQGKNPR